MLNHCEVYSVVMRCDAIQTSQFSTTSLHTSLLYPHPHSTSYIIIHHVITTIQSYYSIRFHLPLLTNHIHPTWHFHIHQNIHLTNNTSLFQNIQHHQNTFSNPSPENNGLSSSFNGSSHTRRRRFQGGSVRFEPGYI